jgi:hypothetical protein
VRHPTSLLILIGVLAYGGAALAEESTLPKTNAEQLKSACAAAGGKFSQDAKSIGCGTNCHGGPGTDCTVYCPIDQKCTAQVIGARHPRSVAEALTKPEQHRR